MSEIHKSLSDQELALIESETKLLHAIPAAGSREAPRPRRPLPAVLEDGRLAQAVRFMECNMSESAQLNAVAAHVDLSPFHFQRYFKDAMGETPAAYVRRIRMDQAAVSLWISDQPVTRIAFGAGYGSHEAFVRAFHRQFGWVPSQYRAHARQASSVPLPEEYTRAETVRVNHLASMPLLAMRFYGPYANVEAHWQKFADVLRQAALPLDRLQVIGVAYDNPEITPNTLIRYDCALVDCGFDQRPASLTELAFPADSYAQLEHHAPYQEIFSTYRVLSMAWLTSVAGEYAVEVIRAYEFYREPPWENHGAAQRFDLVLPVRKVR